MDLVKSSHSYNALGEEHVPACLGAAHIVARMRNEICSHDRSLSSTLGGGCLLKWYGQWMAAGYHFFPTLHNQYCQSQPFKNSEFKKQNKQMCFYLSFQYNKISIFL